MPAHKSPIRAVTFDAGGTCLHPWPSVGSVYAKVAAAWTGRRFSPRELSRRFSELWRTRTEFDHSRAAWMQLVDEVFAGLVEEPPSRTFFGQLYRHFGQPEVWRVDPHLRPLLVRLRARGLRLGLISNWDLRLRPLLRALKLEPAFDAIVISAEVGFAKPSPAIYLHAAEILQVAPEQILHVGDDPRADYEAARQAGYRAVLLVPGQKHVRRPSIGSLRQLAPWFRHFAGLQLRSRTGI